ncbi:MAG: ribose-phosphate pyrophosphokinase [Ignavibacteriales bacterium]|nr:ribose-phosphate pyrophosphokinase [Ignavibacteriales bacterium]
MLENRLRVFSGTSNPELTEKIVDYIGVKPGIIEHKKFSDGELWCKFGENIRGRDVFIVQSTQPSSDNLMQLLMMLDAAKRASVNRVTAVIPYFGYARQDRKDQPRVPITAKLVANLITIAGADRIITMDLHAAQLQGFFDIPLDHLYASPVFSNLFNDIENIVVVAPDVGGIKLARSYAKRLNTSLVVIDKRRPKPNQSEIMNIIGDVKDKNALLIDDLIDTGGTFVSAVNALKERGAKQIFGAVTHPVLSGNAIEKIENSPIDKLYVTDSIPIKNLKENSKICVKTSSELLAKAIIRSHHHESVSSLFEIDKN